jgi:hypothetical protein
MEGAIVLIGLAIESGKNEAVRAQRCSGSTVWIYRSGSHATSKASMVVSPLSEAIFVFCI